MSVRIIKHGQRQHPPRFIDGATRLYPVHSRRPVSRFGEWLVRRGLISRADLFTGLSAAHRHRCRLGDALVWLEVLDREAMETEAQRFGRFANSPPPGTILR